MYNPLVSIVIPAYNASNYLEESVNSALAQTYKNIEIIVVNDGSKDSGATRAVAEKFGDKIVYIEKKNGGSSSALNTGIKNMRGEWFSWLSHDDLYLPEKIETQIEYMNALGLDEEKNKNNVFFSSYELINAEGKTFRKSSVSADESFAKKINSAENNAIFIAEPSKFVFHGCSCFIHRSVFEKIGAFDESLRFLNDVDLWYRLYAGGYKINYIPQALVKGRVHAKQVSKSIGFSYHNSEQDMYWKRSFDWLVKNCPEEYDLFVKYGKDAYLKTRNVNGDEAFDFAASLDPRKKTTLKIKKIAYKMRASVRNFAKKVYLKIFVRN